MSDGGVIARARPPGRGARRSYPAGVQWRSAVTEHEPRLAVVQDERAVRQVVERDVVQPPLPPARCEPLSVELQVDGVGARLPGVEVVPDRPQTVVVLAPAERACPVPGRHRRRLVEEEELRELPRPEERPALPAPELEPAGDPAPGGVAAADPAGVIVEAAAVAVDEPSRRMCDEVAERRHPVLERHAG